MAITVTTIENLTVCTGSGTATDVFVPSKAEIGRYRIRVVRYVQTGTTSIADGATITGITPKPDGTGNETQTLWRCVAPAASAYVDQTSFPDECEFRGQIQVAMTVNALGAGTLFLYHG